jgi:hypothetical protein
MSFLDASRVDVVAGRLGRLARECGVLMTRPMGALKWSF